MYIRSFVLRIVLLFSKEFSGRITALYWVYSTRVRLVMELYVSEIALKGGVGVGLVRGM